MPDDHHRRFKAKAVFLEAISRGFEAIVLFFLENIQWGEASIRPFIYAAVQERQKEVAKAHFNKM